jgi:CheY-like chemotaxis protein
MHPMRVLVVDDDPAVTRILVRVFERSGFPAVSAANGRQALSRLSREKYDIMICDIDMPEMNGRQLCLHLSASGPYLPECTVIVTSRTEEEERSWINDYPDVLLVEKPISPKDILRMVTARIASGPSGAAPAEGDKAA